MFLQASVLLPGSVQDHFSCSGFLLVLSVTTLPGTVTLILQKHNSYIW